ncbi:MAG TPA: ABC transporter ATP-binding protein [Candidatus Angelobacter sp.]
MKQLMRLLGYIRPYSLQFFASVVLMAAVGALEAFRLLLLRPIFDSVLNPASRTEAIPLFRLPWGAHRVIDLHQFVPRHSHNVLTVVAIALVSASIIKGVCDYLGTYLVNYAGYGLTTDLRNSLYKKILARSISFFSRYPTGTLISTIVNDIEKVQFALSTVMAEFLQQFFTFLFLTALVIVTGGRMAWILVLFIPFVVISSGKIGRRVRQTTRKGQDKLAEIQNILHETITGNRIVKAFSMETWENLRFFQAARRLFRANLRSVRAQALSSPLMDIIGYVAIALLLWLGRDQIKRGVFTESGFLVFIAACFKLYDPIRKFALFNNSFQQAVGASSEIFRFMDEEDEIKERKGAIALPPFQDRIRFDKVSFSYGDNNGNSGAILRDVDLEVGRGEIVALVGSSGAGKSTLVQLIPRFFDVTSGAVTIDGYDIRNVTLPSLRSQIGVVTQETILFNDTVRNNIAYGQPQVPDDAVLAAAKAALAHDFIQKMADGYNTIIGEKGVRLSGGERQRIAIARALLKNAPILILDEATSALDNESEALVQSALQNLMAGRTVFVIAHRLTTIRRVDRIVVLDNGRISDSGTHEDLLTRLGTYRKLYELQFMDLEQTAVVAAQETSLK